MARLATGANGFAMGSALRGIASLSSGAGVLLVGILQMIVGISLLGTYEGYKTAYFNSRLSFNSSAPGMPKIPDDMQRRLVAERAIYFRTPLDPLFWFSVVACISAAFGLAGIFTSQPTLCTIFFAYNLVQTVLSFSFFVDVLADKRVEYVGKLHSLVGYEVAAAIMLFLMFVLSLASLYFTVKAVREIKQKQRESYHEMSSVVGDTLQFEPDLA